VPAKRKESAMERKFWTPNVLVFLVLIRTLDAVLPHSDVNFTFLACSAGSVLLEPRPCLYGFALQEFVIPICEVFYILLALVATSKYTHTSYLVLLHVLSPE
jgi:hypothetical protein